MSLVFGDFELDQERRQLLRSGAPVPLEPKAYELLCLLVERRPRALSRAQIRDVVWPDTNISESTLGVVVNGLRQALEDDAQEPRFIRTVRGFGYAFVGEVREGSGDQGQSPTDGTAGAPPVSLSRGRSPIPRWGAVGALIAVALGWWFLARSERDTPAGPITITPFTTDGGFKDSPELSPDGEKVAYAWAGRDGDNWDIYIKAVGLGSRPFRLTEHPASDWSPAWSPDGRTIAFVRRFESGAALYTVPSLGGQERKLSDLKGPLGLLGYFLPALDWSSDGRWLTFAEKPLESEPVHIVRLSLETLERQSLTSPPDGSLGDFHPALSPDGTHLAFVRSGVGLGAGAGQDVWVQPVEGGRAERLTFGVHDLCHSLAWTPDGEELVFSAGPHHAQRTYRVDLEGGDPVPVPGTGVNAESASVRAHRMVFLQATFAPADIWRVPGPTSRRDRVPEKLVVSSQIDDQPAISPDGRRVAFTSFRSGQAEIWRCNSDGSDPVQLTSFETNSGTPRWSPDGRSVIFDSVEAGDWNVYVMEADGGIPRRLTPESSDDYGGVWSRDGRRVYFTSNRGGSTQVWTIPAEGSPAVQVTKGGGVYPQVSWDDTHVYFGRDGGVRRMPVAGGEESEVVPGPLVGWALSRKGIYYVAVRARVLGEPVAFFQDQLPHELTIWHRDVESGEMSELFQREGPFSWGSLTVSPDEKWILYSEAPIAQSELTLVENFR